MFDTTIHHSEVAPAYPQTVHERRAPTEDSVRLLRDMEGHAAKDALRRVCVADNEFRFVCFQRDYGGCFSSSWHIRFTVNGEEIVLTVEEDAAMRLAVSPLEAANATADAIHDAIARAVADFLMRHSPVGRELARMKSNEKAKFEGFIIPNAT